MRWWCTQCLGRCSGTLRYRALQQLFPWIRRRVHSSMSECLLDIDFWLPRMLCSIVSGRKHLRWRLRDFNFARQRWQLLLQAINGASCCAGLQADYFILVFFFAGASVRTDSQKWKCLCTDLTVGTVGLLDKKCQLPNCWVPSISRSFLNRSSSPWKSRY